MAAAPQFKVYNPRKQYIASCKNAEDAACLAALHGDGSTVRWGHSLIVWNEGAESRSAGESYDYAAQVIYDRCDEQSAKTFAKYHTKGA